MRCGSIICFHPAFDGFPAVRRATFSQFPLGTLQVFEAGRGVRRAPKTSSVLGVDNG